MSDKNKELEKIVKKELNNERYKLRYNNKNIETILLIYKSINEDNISKVFELFEDIELEEEK